MVLWSASSSSDGSLDLSLHHITKSGLAFAPVACEAKSRKFSRAEKSLGTALANGPRAWVSGGRAPYSVIERFRSSHFGLSTMRHAMSNHVPTLFEYPRRTKGPKRSEAHCRSKRKPPRMIATCHNAQSGHRV